MDGNISFVREKSIERTIASLKKNNINGYLASSDEEIHSLIKSIAPAGSSVATGGSMTLIETGTEDFLKKNYDYIAYDHGSIEDSRKIFSADVFLCSANAITENGIIYNVDGNGNRVAATIWGPKKVILVVGANKIVANVEEAVERNRRVSAPANAKRLNRKTPCVKTGVCMNCDSPERICNVYALIEKQRFDDRMHVIFVNRDLGF